MRKQKARFLCHIDRLEFRRLLSTTLFVSPSAPGPTHDGSSWADAYTDLQTALSHASTGDVVAVAHGTYKPTSSTDRTASFHLTNGITIEGGFAGTGSPGPRDPLYPTILSGDIGTAGNSDNSYHVVYARNIDSTGVLDGFTITAGNANVGFGNTSQGGGVFDSLGSPTINDCTISGNAATGGGGGVVNLYSSVALTNCTISGNTTAARGGGIYDYESSPSLTNCTISANTANANEGGGISNKKSSDPILTNCTISGNSAATGGGIANYNSSSPELTNCILSGNTATQGGGVWSLGNSSPTLINCVINGNSATSGGGGLFSEGTSNPALTNCTLSGNSAQYGGAIYNNSNASATLTNSILWGDTASTSDNEIDEGPGGTNTTTISFSDVEGGINGVNNNIVADPKFIRAAGAGGPSDFGNLRLQSISPAIGAGNASASGLTGITTDLDGLSRTVSSHVDMGAYEAHFALQSTVFVDSSATGNNTGSDWADAYRSLAAALDYAVSGETIEVAQGTYYPTADENRFDTFQLVDGVSVEGGFAGKANPGAARNIAAYPTILSGDIGVPASNSDNSYHVIYSNGVNGTAVLDGFTITAGNASNSSHYQKDGGGILNLNGSPTISDCVISGNTATHNGGGIYNYNASPILSDCTVSGNTSSYSGGGIYNQSHSSPILTNCIISGNSVSHSGGGIYNDYHSSPTLTNCIISSNSAATDGGGIDNNLTSSPVLTDCTISGNMADYGGGIYNLDSSPTLVSCTITGNTASLNGGGIYNYTSSATLTNCVISGNTADTAGGGMFDNKSSSPALTNCTFSGNSAIGGGAIYNENSASIPILTNCILWDDAPSMNEIGGPGSAVVSFSDIDQSGFAGSNNNIDADPMFIRNAGTNGITDFGDLNLKLGSPAINVGSNQAIVGTTSDINGNPRVISSTVDMGASETFPIIFVDAHATGTGDGSSFANAFTTLTDALAHATAGSGQSIEVAQGTYKPTAGTDRTATFQLSDGISILGGFAGDTTANPGQRNAALFATILSGDIGTTGSNADNSYHVVTGSHTDSTAVLDGFTITAANASNGAIQFGTEGGGIIIVSGSPTINHCIISGNTATDEAGGIYNRQSSPTLIDCTISGNTTRFGGGIFNLYHSSPILTNCIISGNTASEEGGGIYSNYDATATLINCTVTGNTATHAGGAIFSIVASTATLTNCIVWNNTGQNGNEISSDSTSSATIVFSDVNVADISGTATLDSSDIHSDPKFVRNVGTNGPTDFGNLLILDTSPAVNVGSNAAIPNGITTDLAGRTRIIGQTVDMGAYEAQFDHLVFDVSPPNNNVAGHSFSFEVDIEDGNGNNVLTDTSSVSVQITGNPSGAALNGTAMLPANQGQAIFSGLNITHAGTYTLSASDGTLPGATSNSFTITAGAPASLTITQQPSNTTAGQHIPLAVEVKDQFGNPMDGSSVKVALAPGASTATLHGTLTLATSEGIATFSDLSIDQAGGYSFAITDGSLNGLTSTPFVINAGAAAKLAFSTEPTNTVAGQAIGQVAVQVQDQFGNPVPGDSSTVSLISTPAGITASAAANHGLVAFASVIPTVSGSYTLTASDGSLASATSTSFTVTPGASAQLIILQQPSSGIAGQAISPVKIEVEDQFGNLTDGTSVTLSAGGSATGATLGGTLTVPTTNGIATFSDLTLDRAGAFTLSATDGSLPAVTTNSFTIGFAGPSLTFSTEPQNAVAGAKLSAFTVETVNTSGTLITTGKSKITLALSSGGKLIGTANAAVKNGKATFSKLSIQKAGTYTLTATDPTFASAVSRTFTISAGAASKLVFNPQPGNTSSTTPFNVSVELTDKYGNAVNDGSTVHLILGSHPKTAASLNLSSSISDGAADFDAVTLDTAGTYTLKASDGKAKATSNKFILT